MRWPHAGEPPMAPVIPVVRLEPGVSLNGLAPGGIRILARVDDATKIIQQDIVITSGTDRHTRGRHPKGEALDLRTKDYDIPTIVKLLRFLTDTLGPRFTALYEVPVPSSDLMLRRVETVNPAATGPHIHVQVKKGTTYPPDDAGDDLHA